MDSSQRGHPFHSKNSCEMLKVKPLLPITVVLEPVRSSFESRITIPRTVEPPRPQLIKPTEEVYPSLECCNYDFEIALKLVAPAVSPRNLTRVEKEEEKVSQLGMNSPVVESSVLGSMLNELLAQKTKEFPVVQEDSDAISKVTNEQVENEEERFSPLEMNQPTIESSASELVLNKLSAQKNKESLTVEEQSDAISPKTSLLPSENDVVENPQVENDDLSLIETPLNPVARTSITIEQFFAAFPLTPAIPIAMDSTNGIPTPDDNSTYLPSIEKEHSISEHYKMLIQEACCTSEAEKGEELKDPSLVNLEKIIQENWSDLSIVNPSEDNKEEIAHQPISLGEKTDYLSFGNGISDSANIGDPENVESENKLVEFVHQPQDNEEEHLEELHSYNSNKNKPEVEDESVEPLMEYAKEPTHEYTLSDQEKSLIEENDNFFKTGQDSVLADPNPLVMAWSQILNQEQEPSAPEMSVQSPACENSMVENPENSNEFDSLVGDFDIIEIDDTREEGADVPETM
ncbi:hypothetical protein L5515_006009 [Caenorhabditis briggsae]|nr:hypothetical protein L5515_006009 [Caenorhabditis briggsae]